MKTILIAVNATFNHTNLAIKYLRQYYLKSAHSRDDMEIICKEFTINDDPRGNTAILLQENADVYGFSCYIWNISIILEMTGILKKLKPGCLIVLGGPEVSFEKQGFFDIHPEVDYIIRGQGELAFTELMNNFPDGKRKIIDGEFVPLSEIPFPYENDDFAIKQKQYYYETSRGCPFCCSYCLSSATGQIDFLPVERVKKEMGLFIDMKLKQVKLVDRTFNFDNRRSMEIWKFLIDRHRLIPYKTNFHFEITADLLSEEAIDLLRTAPKGIFQFEIGIQSTDTEVLENVHRKSRIGDVFANIRKIKELDNISIHLDLIAGLPGESWSTFSKSFNDVFSLRPSMLQMGFLKVLKGSTIREDAGKFSIEFSDQPPYEVLSTETMSFFELLRLKNIEKLVDKYYNSSQFKYSLEFLTHHTSDVFGMFSDLEKFWEEKGMFKRKVARQETIQIFLEFGIKMIGKDNQKELFRDSLKFDYYRFDKKTAVESLGINHSNHHPDLPRDRERKSWFLDDGRPSAVKPRLEHYSFDAAKLIETDDFVEADSFILYEMNGDRPEIIDILVFS